MTAIFIDGDFKSGIGECKYHCSPTCHPCQIGPEWQYGCTHPAWPQNKEHDFVPIVNCGGMISKCELFKYKYGANYYRGKKVSLHYATKKVQRLQIEIAEYIEFLNKAKELKGETK